MQPLTKPWLIHAGNTGINLEEHSGTWFTVAPLHRGNPATGNIQE